jgi:hypothetical protein
MTVSVGDVSLQVGAVDATARPRDVPNAIRTRERADATSAPAMTGLQWKMSTSFDRCRRGRLDRLHRRISPSAQAEEREDEQDHDDQTDQINQPTHGSAPRSCPSANNNRPGAMFPSAVCHREICSERASHSTFSSAVRQHRTRPDREHVASAPATSSSGTPVPLMGGAG